MTLIPNNDMTKEKQTPFSVKYVLIQHSYRSSLEVETHTDSCNENIVGLLVVDRIYDILNTRRKL